MGYNGFNRAEQGMASRIDRAKGQLESSDLVRLAQAKTAKLFEGEMIRPESFNDRYDSSVIAKDLQRVKELKDNAFTVDNQKVLADILEGIVFEQTELADWFGPDAVTLKTSEFDDIVHGVDLLIEMHGIEADSLRSVLAVDATFGSGSIEKKLGRIKTGIDNDRLAEIKYYESSDGKVKDKISQVPRVILGVERGTVLSLARLWTEGKKNELAMHPVQDLLIKQARSQLSAFHTYAVARHRTESARAYSEALRALRAVSASKEPLPQTELATSLYKDKVHTEILMNLGMFN